MGLDSLNVHMRDVVFTWAIEYNGRSVDACAIVVIRVRITYRYKGRFQVPEREAEGGRERVSDNGRLWPLKAEAGMANPSYIHGGGVNSCGGPPLPIGQTQ